MTRPWRARAEATAARQDMVSFAIASRLVRLEGGYSGAVLAALSGYSGAISVMDYRALADARVFRYRAFSMRWHWRQA